MTYRIAVDIGGTFTDSVIVDERGDRTVAKALTTHEELTAGVIESVSLNARQRGLEVGELLRDTDMFAHGTTVATNAVLVRSGARAGLITTKGHEDAMFIGKVYAKRAGLHERDAVHASRLEKPQPIIPRHLVRGVTERMDVEGDVVVKLDEQEVCAAIDALVQAGVEAIAVCLLWSFANPSHERRIAELLRERAPGIFASLSYDLAPVMGEYERAATTAVNAYVGPKVVGYLQRLEERLSSQGLRQPLLVMQASGGLTSVAEATARPIVTLDSGPTGGVLGCRYLGEVYGERNVICTDVGGTSFDVAVISDGEVPIETDPVVSQYTLRLPKVSVQSIGSGGGSVAWVDQGGLLRVGPRSAGSRPGPACYGLGGTDPTVTDADVILGYIDPANFLGGRMRLDRDLALRAYASLGARLGMEPEEVALGTFRIVNAQMSDLIRKSTIELGHDPRECVLVAYGGSGPTHAAFYGADIGAKSVLILPDATAFSAEGMLTCGITHSAEASRLVRSPLDDNAMATIRENFAELRARVLQQFDSEGIAAEEVELERALGIRYRLQVHSLHVEVSDEDLGQGTSLLARFHERYARKYGSGALLDGGGAEIERHRVTGRHPTVAVAFHARAATGGSDASRAVKGMRQVCFTGGFVDTPVYAGELLEPGQVVDAPAVVERIGATTVIPPSMQGTVDEYLTMHLRCVGPTQPDGRATYAEASA